MSEQKMGLVDLLRGVEDNGYGLLDGASEADIHKAADEIEHLRGLLADKDYIAMKSKHNAGQLSWANMLNERERRDQ